jgi:hypothetical protein
LSQLRARFETRKATVKATRYAHSPTGIDAAVHNGQIAQKAAGDPHAVTCSVQIARAATRSGAGCHSSRVVDTATADIIVVEKGALANAQVLAALNTRKGIREGTADPKTVTASGIQAVGCGSSIRAGSVGNVRTIRPICQKAIGKLVRVVLESIRNGLENTNVLLAVENLVQQTTFGEERSIAIEESSIAIEERSIPTEKRSIAIKESSIATTGLVIVGPVEDTAKNLPNDTTVTKEGTTTKESIGRIGTIGTGRIGGVGCVGCVGTVFENTETQVTQNTVARSAPNASAVIRTASIIAVLENAKAQE